MPKTVLRQPLFVPIRLSASVLRCTRIMRSLSFVTVLSACALVTITHALTPPPSCHGVPNTLPIDTSGLTLINETTHGRLYRVGHVTPELLLLHMWGTPYEMGFAQGTLLREQLINSTTKFWDWIGAKGSNFLSWLPRDVARVFSEYGAAAVLDMEWLATDPYTPPAFYEEARGMGDASGVDADDIYRIQMFPELIKGSCSMVGAWGDATLTNKMLVSRNLDWVTESPFQEHPLVYVYHPNDGQAFASLGWVGFYGSITGYSSRPLALCEKAWQPFHGATTRFGTPWNFVTRDVLQFASDRASAVSMIEKASRTCSIYVGLGDPSGFDALEYSFERITVWNDTTSPRYADHPYIPHVVYLDKHPQPSDDPCLGDLLQQSAGTIEATTLFQQIAPLHQTGTMHLAVADFSTGTWYVSNAAPWNGTYAEPAYQRQFVAINMTAAFAEKQPLA